jgi:hypothetical protein
VRYANGQGWDTTGISNIGALTDGGIKLAFTGKDGQTRNIFIPADTIGALVANLIAVNDVAHKLTGVSQPLSCKFMLGVKHAAIVSDASGREYGLSIVTRDGLDLWFLLDRETTEGFAMSLAATLAKHGINIADANGSAH